MAMAFEEQGDEICRRMSELRRDLSSDVREVSRNARVITDWRFYVRRFPWATVGVAAAAGFMLIPRKKVVQVISPDPNALAEMFRKEQLRVETPERAKGSQSLIKTLLVMGISWAAKTGMNYMSEQLRVGAVPPTPVAKPSSRGVEPPPRPQAWPK